MAPAKKASANVDYGIKPWELLEARETIRRFDPALAFRLDVLFPIEECDHHWSKAHRPGQGSMVPDYICRGCKQKVHPMGRTTKYWTTHEKYVEQNKRLVEAIKVKPRPRMVVR